MKYPYLKINNLSKRYAATGELFRTAVPRKVLDVAEFTIYRREILALVGESGSGKTTFGRCLLRLEKADSGEVFYQDEDLLDMRAGKFRRLQRKFQMIFQDPAAALNPRQNLRQALAEPLRLLEKLSGVQLEQRLQQICDEVSLSAELLPRFPHQLSSGQMQRACIARALSVLPELLIADEPTANLDAVIKGQIIELLQNLQQQHGLTVLFITHDLAAIENVADRIAVMREGAICEIFPANHAAEAAVFLAQTPVAESVAPAVNL